MADINKKRPRRTREVTVRAVMLHARSIIEDKRTLEFLQACEERGFTMRATPEFLQFAHDFAKLGSAADTAMLSAGAPANRFTLAVRRKNCDDLTR